MSLMQKIGTAGASTSRATVPVFRAAPSVRRAALSSRQSLSASAERLRFGSLVACAVAEGQEVQGSSVAAASEPDWVPVCLPEELPKGVRKEVEVDGRQVLLFWYRNQIYAIQGRSPAEGAYSEGFIKAKFTQDFAIECPATGSLFSLKDGSIISWYPNNAVLRALTPQDTVSKMEIYPIKLTQDAIMVDVSRGTQAVVAKGGAGTSLENNNIFSVMPTVYFEGMDPTKEEANVYQTSSAPEKINPAIVVVATVALGTMAIAGTAVCVYLENLPLLGAFWIVLGGGVGLAGYNYVNKNVAK